MKKEILKFYKNHFLEFGYKKSGEYFIKDTGSSILTFKYTGSRFMDGFHLDIYVTMKFEDLPLKDVIKDESWLFETRYERIIRNKVPDPTHLLELEGGNENLHFHLNKSWDNIKFIIIPELEKLGTFDYLRANYPDNFDHQTWWLVGISKMKLIELLQPSN